MHALGVFIAGGAGGGAGDQGIVDWPRATRVPGFCRARLAGGVGCIGVVVPDVWTLASPMAPIRALAATTAVSAQFGFKTACSPNLAGRQKVRRSLVEGHLQTNWHCGQGKLPTSSVRGCKKVRVAVATPPSLNNVARMSEPTPYKHHLHATVAWLARHEV